MNAARVGRLAGIAEVIFFAPVLGKIGLGVETANRHTGNRGEAGVAMLVEICVGRRAGGPLGRFFRPRKDGGSQKCRRSGSRLRVVSTASLACDPRWSASMIGNGGRRGKVSA